MKREHRDQDDADQPRKFLSTHLVSVGRYCHAAVILAAVFARASQIVRKMRPRAALDKPTRV